MPSSNVLNLTDPYQYQEAVRGSDLRLTLAGRGPFQAELTRIDLHQLWLQRGHVSLPAVTRTALRSGRSAFVFLADADQRPMLNNGADVSSDCMVSYSLTSQHHIRAGSNYRCCAMSLLPEDLASVSRALVGHELASPSATRVLRPAPAALSRLRGLHKAACDLAASVPDMLAHPEVAKALEQELVRAMVACLSDPDSDEKHASKPARLRVMQRLEQLLEERQGETLYLADICQTIGASERALRLHCQEHLGMAPHRYLWLRRMNLARRALTVADPSAKTVTQVANDYGFAELGRFAVCYKRLFGESPSATLRHSF